MNHDNLFIKGNSILYFLLLAKSANANKRGNPEVIEE